MNEQPRDYNELQTAPRPIAAMAKEYPANYLGFRHRHARAQFLYAASGSMRLTMDVGCWIIPPKRAAWLPAEYPHQTGSIGPLEMRTLYLKPEILPADAPGEPRMLQVNPLLHELILRSMELPVEYDEEGHDGRILNTLVGEIDWTELHPVSLPSLQDVRLRKIEMAVMHSRARRLSLDDWASELGAAPSTLIRIIRRETGLSFQAWRDQILAFAAIPMLAEGRPLVEIADDLGYDTAWSFTAMFKRVTGKVPSRFSDDETATFTRRG